MTTIQWDTPLLSLVSLWEHAANLAIPRPYAAGDSEYNDGLAELLIVASQLPRLQPRHREDVLSVLFKANESHPGNTDVIREFISSRSKETVSCQVQPFD